MKRRLLVVLEAGDAMPSGVIRALIYRAALAEAFDLTIMNRRPAMLVKLAEARGGLGKRMMGLGIARALYALARVAAAINDRRIRAAARGSDIVYMSKVTSFPFMTKLRAATKARLVLDFGDAVWLSKSARRFEDLLATVDAVTTDNEYTAGYVRRFNSRCTVIPDPPQVEYFDRRRAELTSKRDARTGDAIVLGWVGSPTTVYNLFRIWPALERVFRRNPAVSLRLVGVSDSHSQLPPFEHVRFSARLMYDQASMIEEVFAMDIGLFPMFAVENSIVRGVLKATVYMSGEVPVICSPVGQTCDVIVDGENGFLADDDAEWEEKIERLIADAALRKRIGRAGLETVRRDFTIDASFRKLKSVLDAEGETA